MARPREDSDGGAPEAFSLDPLKGYKPLKRPGPVTTLTEAVGLEVCRHIAAGRTLRDAASKAGTSDVCVQEWLKRGREAIGQGRDDGYSCFVVEYEHAGAHFREALDSAALENIGNKAFNEKYVRWRLAVSAPKDFTLPREGPAVAGNGLGALFEMVTPEQARARLEEKLARFLDEHDREAGEVAGAAPVGASDGG